MIDLFCALLVFAEKHARWVLVLGLVCGLLFQNIAAQIKQFIPHFIALLLFMASLRIGWEDAVGAITDLKRHLVYTGIFQVVTPLLIILFSTLLGVYNNYVLALVLVAAAAPISGSPNLVIMLGHEPAPALRQLVIGTALLPLTVLPVFIWLPELGETLLIVKSSLKLLVVIALSSFFGFCIRAWFLPTLSKEGVKYIDGASAVFMAMVVVGLMWALTDAFEHRPGTLLMMLVFAFVVNIGLQVVGRGLWRKLAEPSHAISLSVISGNRNVALYLTALPASVTEEFFLFIGCYQFPMYLTPLLMKGWYQNSDTES